MGTVERREREKEYRRNEILNAAEKIFFSKGIQYATMDEVAEEAELSKGTLYIYFKSKEEIFGGICERAGLILREKFEKAYSENQKGIDKIYAVGLAYYEFSKEYPDYFNSVMHYEMMEYSKGKEFEEGGVTYLKDDTEFNLVIASVQAGIDDGTIRKELDPVHTALLLYGMSRGVIKLAAKEAQTDRGKRKFDPEDLMNKFFEFVGYSLSTDNSGWSLNKSDDIQGE